MADADNVLLLQAFETSRQGARVERWHRFVEVAEALRTRAKIAKNQRGPFLADHMHRRADATDAWF